MYISLGDFCPIKNEWRPVSRKFKRLGPTYSLYSDIHKTLTESLAVSEGRLAGFQLLYVFQLIAQGNYIAIYKNDEDRYGFGVLCLYEARKDATGYGRTTTDSEHKFFAPIKEKNHEGDYLYVKEEFTLQYFRLRIKKDGSEIEEINREGELRYVQDRATGNLYKNESRALVRLKCAELTLVVPFYHTFWAVVLIATRILKLISLYYFWPCRDVTWRESFKNCGWDLALNFIHVIGIVGLQLSAIYGVLVDPYGGRKVYATGERIIYGKRSEKVCGAEDREKWLAPCFQPLHYNFKHYDPERDQLVISTEE